VLRHYLLPDTGYPISDSESTLSAPSPDCCNGTVILQPEEGAIRLNGPYLNQKFSKFVNGLMEIIMKKILITSVVSLIGVALMGSAVYRAVRESKHSNKNNNVMNNEKSPAGSATIYFAGGCFWGTEHFFKQIEGVTATEVGYANGHIKNPTYEQVVQNNTGFAETVKVSYDAESVDLNRLVDLYFKSIDPTSLNKQGNDRGTQYRTGIYYTQEEQLPLIKQAMATVAKQYALPIVVEVTPLENFYTAEDYHQDYLDKNPNGYCHISPALFELARKTSVKKAAEKQADADTARA